MLDVRGFNCKKYAQRDNSGFTYFGPNFQNFNIDDKKVSEPIFSNFTDACEEIDNEIQFLSRSMRELASTLIDDKFFNSSYILS